MIDRRLFLGGAAAATLATRPARAETGPVRREFRILRAGDPIGLHTLEARREGATITVDIAIEIVVRVLGIAAYRYELTNREVWQDGAILSVESRVDDDGEDHFARIRREGDQLAIEGSEYTGTAPLDAATTSYWSRAFLDRRPWISTQTGKPLAIDTVNSGNATAPGGIAATLWRVTGEFETALLYDASGEWVGCEFDAGGELATYEMTASSGRFADLWSAA